MMNNLQDLQQKVARKPLLERKLYELHSQQRQYYNTILSLRTSFCKEQEDVERLEGRSLSNYFYQVIGKLDDKLSQERQEAYAAKVKLDAAEQELSGIESYIHDIQSQIVESLVAEAKYKDALEAKRLQLRSSGTHVADRILGLEEKIAALQARKQEIREAISVGCSARSTADRIRSELDDADGWNTWDMFGGGGIITHMAKHSHLDEAQDLVQELQSQLRRFKTELADIQISANMQVNIDGFLRFADYFFDGLFADWAVGDKISQAQSSVSNTKSQINRMLDKLNSMEANTDREIAALKTQLENLLVKS